MWLQFTCFLCNGIAYLNLSYKAVLHWKMEKVLTDIFLILLRIFLKLESHFSTPPRSFYSKVIPDGTCENSTEPSHGIPSCFVKHWDEVG
jgi:hypothetical protein